MTDERGTAWRGYWPVALLAVTFLAVVLLFGAYLNGRQHAAEVRAEKQRRAICAILANIPGRIPPEIVNARGVFARPGHPGDCEPITHPATKHAATPTPTPAPTASATVIIVNPGARATATVTARPSPTPRSSPKPTTHSSRQPTPAPSPSRTCVLTICTGGSNVGRAEAAETALRLVRAQCQLHRGALPARAPLRADPGHTL